MNHRLGIVARFFYSSLEFSKSLHGAVALLGPHEFRRGNSLDLMIKLHWLQTLPKHLLAIYLLRQFSLDHLFDILLFEVVLDSLLVIRFALVFLDSLGDYVL